MGCLKHKADKVDKKGLKQVLGRIFRPRHAEEPVDPFLVVKDGQVKVRLDHVIQCIQSNPADDDTLIVGRLGSQYGIQGVRPADIEIVRAYIHRFGSDISHPLPITAHEKHILLLDENTPQPAMYHLSRRFGWATHVAAEGLAGRDTPDQDIWEFACRENFGAIVTRDTDFLYIQKERGGAAVREGQDHVPLLIFVGENLSTESLSGLFDRSAGDIRHYLSAGSHLACSLSTQEGCRPLF